MKAVALGFDCFHAYLVGWTCCDREVQCLILFKTKISADEFVLCQAK